MNIKPIPFFALPALAAMFIIFILKAAQPYTGIALFVYLLLVPLYLICTFRKLARDSLLYTCTYLAPYLAISIWCLLPGIQVNEGNTPFIGFLSGSWLLVFSLLIGSARLKSAAAKRWKSRIIYIYFIIIYAGFAIFDLLFTNEDGDPLIVYFLPEEKRELVSSSFLSFLFSQSFLNAIFLILDYFKKPEKEIVPEIKKEIVLRKKKHSKKKTALKKKKKRGSVNAGQ
ncbi:hypothetical protein LRR81_11570 [Metabacillus sp. GX 13764]|uniref:hypothetical protein n=1 Tax=Metabacillus kandeliae TaxID=2900151 RepID=UPI001E578DC0|nr:hypothetical protein [Metabacillus kandeliae]MCD7034885.1 hypothetical protein [Metabacillus kandeliae]